MCPIWIKCRLPHGSQVVRDSSVIRFKRNKRIITLYIIHFTACLPTKSPTRRRPSAATSSAGHRCSRRISPVSILNQSRRSHFLRLRPRPSPIMIGFSSSSGETNFYSTHRLPAVPHWHYRCMLWGIIEHKNESVEHLRIKGRHNA